MTLTQRHLTGTTYLATATDLLQRIRLEGAHEINQHHPNHHD